jgi:DNA-binding NarL/FixJ family response regulator
MVRAGLISMLQRDPGNEVVGEAGDGRQAVEMARKLQPDVIFCDVTMPLLNGIEATRHIREFSPREIKVIMISVHYDQTMVTEALRAGANGYLLKTSAAVELQLAVRAAREGATYLSPRVGQVVVDGLLADRDPERPRVFSALTAKQREVLQLLAEGKTNKEVAACLCISAKTVEAHRGQLMEKLHIHTVAGLTKYAIREGITSVEG